MSNAPSLAEDRDQLELRDVREAASLPMYIAGIWRRRAYAWFVAKSELRSRQMDSFLGNLWHLLNPILSISVYFVIFGIILSTDRGVDNFIAFLAVGVFTYRFTQGAVGRAGRSMRANRGLIQIVSFPRALLPITSILTEVLASLPAFLVMLAVAWGTGEAPKLTWLLVFPVLAIQAVFTAGFGLVAARLVTHVPDLANVLPFLFRLGFYGSGVMFNVNSYVEKGHSRLPFELNPAYCFIEINRAFVLDGRPLSMRLVASAAMWTIILPVVGLLFFRRSEDTYGMS